MAAQNYAHIAFMVAGVFTMPEDAAEEGRRACKMIMDVVDEKMTVHELIKKHVHYNKWQAQKSEQEIHKEVDEALASDNTAVVEAVLAKYDIESDQYAHLYLHCVEKKWSNSCTAFDKSQVRTNLPRIMGALVLQDNWDELSALLQANEYDNIDALIVLHNKAIDGGLLQTAKNIMTHIVDVSRGGRKRARDEVDDDDDVEQEQPVPVQDVPVFEPAVVADAVPVVVPAFEPAVVPDAVPAGVDQQVVAASSDNERSQSPPPKAEKITYGAHLYEIPVELSKKIFRAHVLALRQSTVFSRKKTVHWIALMDTINQRLAKKNVQAIDGEDTLDKLVHIVYGNICVRSDDHYPLSVTI